MRILTRALCLLAMGAVALPVFADEIQLKDGKKFYGTIVAYDNKMFKVKTDFGFVLVEKEKIAAIIPNVTEASQPDAKPGASSSKSQPTTDRAPSEALPVKNTAPTPDAEPASCYVSGTRRAAHFERRSPPSASCERTQDQCCRSFDQGRAIGRGKRDRRQQLSCAPCASERS